LYVKDRERGRNNGKEGRRGRSKEKRKGRRRGGRRRGKKRDKHLPERSTAAVIGWGERVFAIVTVIVC